MSATSADAAAAHCTGRAVVPQRVVLTRAHLTVRAVLQGTAGCAAAYDQGATATMTEPDGTALPLRWRRIGQAQPVELYAALHAVGRYTVGRGDVQVYDSLYERVPSDWATTTMTVKRGARIVGVERTGRTLRARVQDWTVDGWQGRRGVLVQLQRTTPAGGWRTLETVRTGDRGLLSVTGVRGGGLRLHALAGAQVWDTATPV